MAFSTEKILGGIDAIENKMRVHAGAEGDEFYFGHTGLQARLVYQLPLPPALTKEETARPENHSAHNGV